MILGVASILGTACKNEIIMEAPVAKKVPHELTIHDDTRIDNYYWLRDREDSTVINYLNEENFAYLRNITRRISWGSKPLYLRLTNKLVLKS